MTSPATSPSAKAAQPPAAPAYLQSELYDSPTDLAHWPLLAPLLRTWQAEVWEKDHSEVRGCWHYDRAAVQLQQRHQWAVVLAATMGTAAVVFAILQLGMEHRIGRAWLADSLRAMVGSSFGSVVVQDSATDALMYLELGCLLLAITTIGSAALYSLDHRWRELRFKAEHYRMLKFRCKN